MASTGSGAPQPTNVKTSDLKSKFLQVAQTSVYQVKLQPPAAVASYLASRNISYGDAGEGIELSCTETSLPGHSLQTLDVTNDYIGVSEKMAYRKMYDREISFTFNVNYKYDVVQMFEGWIDYIAGHQGDPSRYIDRYASYRMNYPTDYRSDNVYITKFEKSVGNEIAEKDTTQTRENQRYKLDYTFVGAFPIAIVPSKVSYDKSQVLSYTVNLDYIRYVCERKLLN